MNRLVACLALTLMVVSACTDHRTPTAPLRPGELPPSLGISDGVHSLGNHGFFFLPPLVRNPDGPEFGDSPAKMNASPTVEICLLNTTDVQQLGAASCDISVPLIKKFSGTEISTGDQQFHVNWHTDDSNIEPGKYYRVTVFVGTQMLGFADLQPVTSAKDLRNPKSGDVIMLVDGRTLPIKFRIEEEAVCEVQDDCVKKRINVAAGGTVTTPSGDAAVVFPSNFVAGAGEIEVTIQKISLAEGEKCHFETTQAKVLAFTFGTCYDIKSTPSIFDLGGFIRSDVKWVQCFAEREEAIPAHLTDFVQTFKSDPPDRGGLKALREASTPEGFCDLRVGSTQAPGAGRFAMLRWRLDRFARDVGGLFVPQTAYAIDGGLGSIFGLGDGFSRIQRGIAASMVRRGEASQTVETGSSVEVRVAVTGIPDHHQEFPHTHEEGEGEGEHTHAIDPTKPIPEFTQPLPGVPVTFELLRDGVRVGDPVTDYSAFQYGEGGEGTSGDGDALATASFTGLTVGAYTVRATSSAAGSPITFAITIVDLGGITGTVSAPDASPLANARLRLVGLSNPTFTRSTSTGEGGSYSFEGVPAGRYTVSVAVPDFNITRRDVSVVGGTTTAVDLVLAPNQPAVDGVFSEGEWGEPFRTFDVNLIGGGTTPGALFIRNDGTNIYFAVRFAQSVAAPGNSASIEFDSNNSGVLDNGDDGIGSSPPGLGFRDLVRSDTRPNGEACPGCSFFDTQFEGGSDDGAAAFRNNGVFTVYEFSHPLSSGDLYDFSRRSGQALGLFVFIRMLRPPSNFPADFGDTSYPAFGQFVTYTIMP